MKLMLISKLKISTFFRYRPFEASKGLEVGSPSLTKPLQKVIF